MFKSFKIAKYSVLAIAFGLYLQQMKHILYAVEATSYADDNAAYQYYLSNRQQPAYGPNSGKEYRQGVQELSRPPNAAERHGLYSQSGIIGTGNMWREGSQNVPQKQKEECGTDGDHMLLIYVPTEAVDKYSWVNKMTEDRSQRVTPIKVCCPGYRLLRWQGARLCIPVCDNCRNGLCVAPNVCKCYDEFVRNDSGDCVFRCPLGCLNGHCYLDESCECDPGYKLDESRQFCRPICSKGCGTDLLHNCTAPEVCGCVEGYSLMDGGCKPVCEPECGVGGECQSSPVVELTRVCVCYQGYRLQDGVCQSDCYQSCNNGICYNRNRCICNPGFVYHERTRNCIPQ